MLIVVCIVAVVVWLLVTAVLSSGRDGSGGEGRVAQRLAKLPPEDYKTVNDVMLPTVDGATTQVDHVVVSRYGIFVIETKDYSGWIFGGENQRVWTQTFKGGRWSGPQKFPFQNPIRQNWRHIYALSDCLGLPHRYFYNVVAFCGDGEFMTEMPGNVMYSVDLCAYIRSFGTPIMSDAKVEQILSKLVRIDAGISDEMRQAHVSRLHANHDPVQLSVAYERGELKCPKCGAKMILRHRKSDGAAFYGCSRYPQCRGTRQA